MPITEELKNIQKLESAGFDHKQAEALVDIIEQAQTNGNESLKDFMRNELNGLELRIDTKLANLKADLMISQKDMLVKIFAIVFGISGILFAMIKVFT